MSVGYIAALDQGTTSSRTLIFDDRCQLVASAQLPVKISTPHSGYVEQDAEQIWQTQISTLQAALSKAKILATDLTALGIANQRETTIIWNKQSGRPIAPAIVWQDRRTSKWCNQFDEAVSLRVAQLTGLRIDPYFSATKIVWLLDNVEGARAQAERGELAFGTVDSWLMWQLTRGDHVIEASNASRTLLYDINKGQWSEELLSLFNIPDALLPQIVPSQGDLGVTAQGLLGKQVAIKAILGDQQAALFGQQCTQAGMAKNTYGTGCFMLLNTGDTPQQSKNKLLTTVAWQMQGDKRASQFALEGSVFMAGAIIEWLKDNLGIINTANEVESLAMQVKSSDGVTLVPAFTGLGAPHWCPEAKAALLGMTRGTTAAHIARAATESIAFQVYDVLTAMQNDSNTPLSELRVDGGVAKNDLLMQFQADLLGVPVVRPKLLEVTAQGVARMAGLQSGLFNYQDLMQFWQLDRRFEPSKEESWREEKRQAWSSAMSRVTK